MYQLDNSNLPIMNDLKRHICISLKKIILSLWTLFVKYMYIFIFICI